MFIHPWTVLNFKWHCFNTYSHTQHTLHPCRQSQMFDMHVFLHSILHHFISLYIEIITYLMWFAIKMIYHRAKRFIWMPRCHLPQKGFLISHAYAYALTKRKDTSSLIHSHSYTLNVDQIKITLKIVISFSFFLLLNLLNLNIVQPKIYTCIHAECQYMMIHWLHRKQTKKWKMWVVNKLRGDAIRVTNKCICYVYRSTYRLLWYVQCEIELFFSVWFLVHLMNAH